MRPPPTCTTGPLCAAALPVPPAQPPAAGAGAWLPAPPPPCAWVWRSASAAVGAAAAGGASSTTSCASCSLSSMAVVAAAELPGSMYWHRLRVRVVGQKAARPTCRARARGPSALAGYVRKGAGMGHMRCAAQQHMPRPAPSARGAGARVPRRMAAGGGAPALARPPAHPPPARGCLSGPRCCRPPAGAPGPQAAPLQRARAASGRLQGAAGARGRKNCACLHADPPPAPSHWQPTAWTCVTCAPPRWGARPCLPESHNPKRPRGLAPCTAVAAAAHCGLTTSQHCN